MCRKVGFELCEIQRYAALPRNMWHRFPRGIRNSQIAANTWNFLDRSLSYPLSFVCQNYLFVAKKPSV